MANNRLALLIYKVFLQINKNAHLNLKMGKLYQQKLDKLNIHCKKKLNKPMFKNIQYFMIWQNHAAIANKNADPCLLA